MTVYRSCRCRGLHKNYCDTVGLETVIETADGRVINGIVESVSEGPIIESPTWPEHKEHHTLCFVVNGQEIWSDSIARVDFDPDSYTHLSEPFYARAVERWKNRHART